jgi:hypothetical protein
LNIQADIPKIDIIANDMIAPIPNERNRLKHYTPSRHS